MNTQELLQAAETMQAAAYTGKVSYKGKRSDQWITQEAQYCKFNWGINDYRVGASFPVLPDGEQWHNPHNRDPEFFDCSNGWRPLMISECTDEEMGDVQLSTVSKGEWEGDRSWWISDSTEYTWRTQRPMPEQHPEATAPVVSELVYSESVAGRVVHNPARLKSAGEGWRFIYVDELDQLPLDAECQTDQGEWGQSGYRGGPVGGVSRTSRTYRTRA